MKSALVVLGILALPACGRPAEGIVRDQAAAAFSCAEYALEVQEIGPDVYRAAGCGMEQIYACRLVRARNSGTPAPDDLADTAPASVMVCGRKPL
jgi:hypothetical protein